MHDHQLRANHMQVLPCFSVEECLACLAPGSKFLSTVLMAKSPCTAEVSCCATAGSIAITVSFDSWHMGFASAAGCALLEEDILQDGWFAQTSEQQVSIVQSALEVIAAICVTLWSQETVTMLWQPGAQSKSVL